MSVNHCLTKCRGSEQQCTSVLEVFFKVFSSGLRAGLEVEEALEEVIGMECGEEEEEE